MLLSRQFGVTHRGTFNGNADRFLCEDGKSTCHINLITNPRMSKIHVLSHGTPEAPYRSVE
jgi:hypothetical protein